MSFAVVLEGMTIAAFAILLVGGKQKREQGWGVLTILVALAAFVQAIGMALMVRLPFFQTLLSWSSNADSAIGLSLRKRRKIFLGMVLGQELDHVHNFLEFPGSLRHCYYACRGRSSERGRL